MRMFWSRYFGWVAVLIVMVAGVCFAEHMGVGKSGRPLGHVGPYTYVSGQRLDALIRAGALDARLEIYAAPDGTKVQYQAVMLHNPDEATFNLQSEVSEQVAAGGKLMYKSALNDANGQDIGEIALVLRSNGIESVYWTNLGLFLNAQANPFHAARFTQYYLGYKVFSQPSHDAPPSDASRPSPTGGAGC